MRAFHVATASAHMMFHDVPGTGTPLVFVHGLGCASSCDYPRIALDPALTGRRMILIDLLGSGFSERPPDFDYTIDSHAGTVAQLVAAICPDGVSIFGHSMGGAIAIAVAAQLGSRAHELVLSEPNLDPGGGSFSRRIANQAEADFLARGHAEMVDAARAEGNVVWAASLATSAALAVHREATSLVLGGKPTWREMLRGLTMPRTVIFGERSLPDPDLELLPLDGCRVDVVPGAGHSMAWDNPSGLAEALGKAIT